MNENGHCSKCGADIPTDAPGGMCPNCLLKRGLDEPDTGPAAPAVDEIRKHFPALEIIELTGRGGMGFVYKAYQPNLDRPVAVKILPTRPEEDPEFAARFLREAQTLAKLHHSNIVTVYDFGETSDFCYFIMEFVEGSDLVQMIASGGTQPRAALDMIMKICDALQYAHDHGVVHRDIKPGNILVDRQGDIKVVDFGLAKILDPGAGDLSLTLSGQSMGTPYYMAPEQRSVSPGVDHRADIYSLGVVMYEMLTGELPAGSFDPPSAKARVSPAMDGIVLKAMKVDPELRYQNAGEIMSAIESAGISDLVTGQEKPGAVSYPLRAAVLTALIIAALAGAAYWSSRKRPPSPPDDVVEFGGNYYKAYFENVSWHQAFEKCIRVGGHLAIVTSQPEDEFVAGISRGHVWLGASDEHEEGAWAWIDGARMSYANWDSDEPNNTTSRETGEQEDYLMMSKYGKWNDLARSSHVIDGYVCEWEGSAYPELHGISSADDLHTALKRANPEYNGEGVVHVRDGVITGIELVHTGVTDLSPLKGLCLSSLDISWAEVTDLSPLEGMPLNVLTLTRCPVENISALAGMPLTKLKLDGTGIKNVVPLKGLALLYLDIDHTKVADLSPLVGMPLEVLNMNCTKVTDLSPLRRMPLKNVGLLGSPIKDLAPLAECRALEFVAVSPDVDNIECLKKLPGLALINRDKPQKFWSDRKAGTRP